MSPSRVSSSRISRTPRTARSVGLDPATLERQRTLLSDERAALVAQLDDIAAEMRQWITSEPMEDSFDEEGGEGGTLSVELQRQEALQTRIAAGIDDIDAALARIDAGTYGRCDSCGDPIGEGRLEALPTARECVACKSAGPLRRRLAG